jgi:DNA polymerase-1
MTSWCSRCRTDEVDWLRVEIPRIMAVRRVAAVPLVAEIGVGANWDQAH